MFAVHKAERPERRTGTFHRLALFAWILVVGAGFGVLARYEFTEGAPASPPEHWPGDSSLAAPKTQNRMLVFVHPGCPCTRTTLDELRQLAEHERLAMDIELVVLQPEPEFTWKANDLIAQIQSLPYSMHLDHSGVEATRFGVTTSGHVLIYDNEGALAFSGGLTASRGHAGWSPGHEAIATLGRNNTPKHCCSPVFGCPLQNQSPSLKSSSISM